MNRIDIPPEFLKMMSHLHRGGKYSYWNFLPAKESDWWQVESPGPLYVKDGENAYFGVHPTNKIPPTNSKGEPTQPMYVRAQTKYIAAINCLYGEFDAKQYGGDLMTLADHIAKLPVKPSVQIFSGAGIHTYFLLTDPVILANSNDRNLATHMQRSWTNFIGADVKDLTRVLRVPGTFNHKRSLPVMLLDCDLTRTYEIEDLRQYLPDPPPQNMRATPNAALHALGMPGIDPIGDFNKQHNIADLLEHYGYRRVGRNRMIAPNSSSGTPGIEIHEDTNKIWSFHESDPLARNHPISPFDVIRWLDYNGNFKLALHAVLRGTI